MRDPVITLADGHSYERSAIEGWLREGIRISPTTGLDLKNTKLVPNRALRDSIFEWVGEHTHREEKKVRVIINSTGSTLLALCEFDRVAWKTPQIFYVLFVFYPFRMETSSKFQLCA